MKSVEGDEKNLFATTATLLKVSHQMMRYPFLEESARATRTRRRALESESLGC